MKQPFVSLIMLLTAALAPACEGQTVYLQGDPIVAIGACSASSSEGSDSSSSEDEGETAPPETTSELEFECPIIEEGDVEFCVDGYPCRSANFMNVDNATALSTMLMYWHGTYEGANNPLSNALPYGMLEAAQATDALVVMPIADLDAVYRTNNPFPWWSVCGPSGSVGCTRDDDYVLADVIAACVVEQGLADPDRLTTSGLSAGGIQTSFLIERGLEVGSLEFAAAASWSGGTPEAFQPTEPASEDTQVFVLHGGETDVYCGVGQPSGTCNGYQPYSFVLPSEEMATDLDDAGNFAFVCNHGQGHGNAMGPQGTEFLLAAERGTQHPWEGFPFGVDGYSSWPGMSGGTNWMLRFWGDCHYPL